jgi:hypothetical protein
MTPVTFASSPKLPVVDLPKVELPKVDLPNVGAAISKKWQAFQTNLKEVNAELTDVFENMIPQHMTKDEQRLASGAVNDYSRATTHSILAGLGAMYGVLDKVPYHAGSQVVKGTQVLVDQLDKLKALARSVPSEQLLQVDLAKNMVKSGVHNPASQALDSFGNQLDSIRDLKTTSAHYLLNHASNQHLAVITDHPVAAVFTAVSAAAATFFALRGANRLNSLPVPAAKTIAKAVITK